MKLDINIDGGSRGNPGPGAAGIVIKNGKDALLARGVFLGECTNNHAEFTALKLAVDEARKLKARELNIYSDSLLLVKQFSGEYKIKNANLKELMAEIKAAGAGLKIKLAHVPRKKNKEADAMVNKALDAAAQKNSSRVFTVDGLPQKKTAANAAAPAAQKTPAKPTPAKGEQLELF